MATKARPGVPPEAPPGRPGNTGLSEADIPTPPVGVFVQGAIGTPSVPAVSNEQPPVIVDGPTTQERNRHGEHLGAVAAAPVAGGPVGPGQVAGAPVGGSQVGGGPVGGGQVGGGPVGGGSPGAPLTRQTTATAPLAPASGVPAPAPAPEAEPEEWEPEEWEEVGTAAWDPASVWDAEDKNELWVKGLGWGVPHQTSGWADTSGWEGHQPSTSGPAVRVGWSAAGWSSAPPLIPGDEADIGLSREEGGAPAFIDDFTVAHPRLAIGAEDDVRAGRHAANLDGAERDEAERDDRQEEELREEAPPPARRGLPWRELVIALAVAVIVAAVVLGVTNPRVNITNSGTPTSSPTLTSAITPGVATGSGAKSSTSAPHTAATVRPTSASAPATTAPLLDERAKALPVTPGVEGSLIKSWVATNPGGYGLSLGDVAGTVPSEVFYAVQPGTGTYWAVAEFQPSPALQAQSATTTGKAELSEFKNSLYAFSWQTGPLWTLLGEVGTGDCPGIWVPSSVLATWGLCGL